MTSHFLIGISKLVKRGQVWWRMYEAYSDRLLLINSHVHPSNGTRSVKDSETTCNPFNLGLITINATYN